jgi:hypothetical protein
MPARKMSSKAPANAVVYQLKITLRDTKPPIWRRVEVLSTLKLSDLHNVIQEAMGWWNGHLHSFEIDGVEYGEPDPNYDFAVRSERQVKLDQVITREKQKFRYTYDFGDGWEHDILVEKVLPVDPEVRYPICLKGKRACPPEDCGGPWGYAELLETLKDPSHPEHDSMLEWVGGEAIDPEEFDLEEVNQRLQSL